MERAEKHNANQVGLWIGIAISALCLLAIFLFIKPAEIVAVLRTARYDYLVAGVGGMLLFLILRAVRWRFLLNHDVGWARTFHIQNIGYMLTMLLPFRLGDVARVVLIGNVPPVSVMRGASTMVVERLLDVLFFVVLLPFTIAGIAHLPDQVRIGAQIAGVLAVAGSGVLIVAANQRPFVHRLAGRVIGRLTFLNAPAWVQRVDDLLDGLDSLTRWRDGVILIFWSIVIWLPVIFSYYVIMRAVGLPVTPSIAAFTVCIAAFGVSAPSSPGQIGVFEAAVTLALITALGTAAGSAAAGFAILYHTAQFILFILMGIVGLFGTGETFGHVVNLTRKYARRNAA